MATKEEVKAMGAEITRLTDLLVTSRRDMEKLTKELEQAKTMQTHYMNNSVAFQAEVHSVHAFLDAVPNAPARKQESGYQDYPVMTRLAVWMATRSNGGGF